MSIHSWISDKLNSNREVDNFSITNNIVNVYRKQGPSFKAIFFTSKHVTQEDVVKLVSNIEVDFVCCTTRDVYVSGDVYAYLNDKEIAFGDLGDFMRYISKDINWPYENPHVDFILIALRQHTKVEHVTRLDNRRYLIRRIGLEDFIIADCEDYEFSGESVRHTKKLCGEFDMILASNHFGKMLDSAYQMAKELGIDIGRMRDVLGRLNKP